MPRQLPKVMYGLHFYPGVAEYREPKQEPYRVYLNGETIKNMDPTFAGRPLYVLHREEVNLNTLQLEADGYVVESFFNPADGKQWVKFVAVSDAAHEAIRNGWTLSNAYVPKAKGPGGLWNGVEYKYEITSAEYEHLALVPDARYAESIVLTPEEFKKYNSERELELKRLANSQGESSVKFFKKEKVENSLALEDYVVVLEKSKKEMSLKKIINDMDEMMMDSGPKMANLDDRVRIGEDEMSVNDLIGKHMAMCQELGDMKKSYDEMKKKNMSVDGDEGEKKIDEEKKKVDPTEKKENEVVEADKGEKKVEEDKKKADPEEDKKKNSFFDEIYGAPVKAKGFVEPKVVQLNSVDRGKSRYGSKK